MANKNFKGEVTAQKPEVQSEGVKFYFDCATMMEERGVVYDEMTPENLNTWFKATKFKFPVRVMGEDDLRAWIYREDGEAFMKVYRYDQTNDAVNDKWTLRIGKTITSSRWFGITRFIEDYLTGNLHKNYTWNEDKVLALA